jgi:hypothetical protein
MIDLLDSVTADLESGHLDAETVCSVALKTIPDDPRALRLVSLACAPEERAHALEYLIRVQNPDLAHLHVEIPVAHRGVGTYGSAVSTVPRALVLGLNPSEGRSNACQRCFPWRQLLQSAGTQVRLEPNKDIDISIEAGALTTLERAWRDHIDSEPFSAAEMTFLAHDCPALDAERSRKDSFGLVMCARPTAGFKSRDPAPTNVQRVTD